MADDRIGLEVEHRLADTLPEHAAKSLDHLRRHVAVSCGLVGHDVAHAAYGKRQLGGAEAHRKELDAGGKLRRIVLVDAGDDGNLVPGGDQGGHRFGQIHAAAGAIGLLSGDAKDTHEGPFGIQITSDSY